MRMVGIESAEMKEVRTVNQITLTGSLVQEPIVMRTSKGISAIWFALFVEDGTFGKPEFFKVMCRQEFAEVLRRARERKRNIMVHGGLHTCTGLDPDVPGSGRFVRAEAIVLLETPAVGVDAATIGQNEELTLFPHR